MLTLRFELHLLVHSFRIDVDDAERPTFHENHLSFYYYRYFKKQLNVKSFGAESNIDLVKLVQDTVELDADKSVLDAQLAEDTPFEMFIRLTEDHRRERKHLCDCGDESAALKLSRPPPRQQHQQYNQPWGRQGWDGGKGHNDRKGGGYPSRQPGPSYGGQQQQYRRDDRGHKGGDGGFKGSRGAPAIGQPVSKGGYGRDAPRENYGYSRDGGYPRDNRGPPPARSRSPPAPPPAARGAPGPSTHGGNQRRSYGPPPSSGGYSQGYNRPQGRAAYGNAPPPSRAGGGGYGANPSSGGGYRR